MTPTCWWPPSRPAASTSAPPNTSTQRLLAQRASGTATILISEDLDEVLALSDRIAVLYEGRVMGIVNRDDTSAEELGLMMAGVTTAI